MHCPAALLVSVLLTSGVAGFDILRDYSGSTFFDNWEFYGFGDNLTQGAQHITFIFLDTMLTFVTQ